ncbi:MAG: alpha/beta hydrolase [Xanthobacteraceae bacterium]|nr:alpha/beta hydrolase [Xanthobacteraceae bacterium]
MTAIDLEAEYNNRARVPEHPAIIAKWKSDAEMFRAAHKNVEQDVYGPQPRLKTDIFWPDASRDAPLALFIHGGYWQALDPSFFSHLAKAANANGVALALCGYNLCPAVSVGLIIEEVRVAVFSLWRRYRRRILACGHSAGGHLTACLLATDWREWSTEHDLPEDLISAGLSVSGLFDLRPLVPTTVNNALQLDEAEAARLSPLHWLLSGKRTLDAWVGGVESAEYLRQSRTVAEAWGKQGAETAYCEIAGANHFTALDPLSDPESRISQRLAALAHALR